MVDLPNIEDETRCETCERFFFVENEKGRVCHLQGYCDLHEKDLSPSLLFSGEIIYKRPTYCIKMFKILTSQVETEAE